MIAILDILKINTNGTFKEEYFYESGISCISDGVKKVYGKIQETMFTRLLIMLVLLMKKFF